MFKDAGDALLHFGGHACAGGFAVSSEKIHEIQEVFSKSYEKLSGEESKTCEIKYDAGISLSDITNATLKDINQLAPFGQGNEKPVFVLENVLLDEVKMFGKNKEHIDVMLSDGNGTRKRAIAFFSNEESFTSRPVAGESVTILANIESSTFAGRTELRMRLIDVR
jgi:single-stranded-DNA-specific exonuclease